VVFDKELLPLQPRVAAGAPSKLTPILERPMRYKRRRYVSHHKIVKMPIGKTIPRSHPHDPKGFPLQDGKLFVFRIFVR
jgi:hypothetical protein